MAATVDAFGRLDVLVNNAAGNFMASSEDLSANAFRTVIDIDLQGCFNMSRAAFPHLKLAGSGLVINITATLQYKAMPFQAHASAAKAAIDALTNVQGVEWGEYGIRVVGIAPGPIAGTVGGPTGRVFGAAMQGNANQKSFIQQFVPLGRWGEVSDIAYTALFLATPAGSYITAEQIVVDGGNWHGTSAYHQRGKAIGKHKTRDESSEAAKRKRMQSRM